MLSYLATATLAVGLLASTPQPPQWESDYGDALKATRSGNQPLLVVIDKPRDEKARIAPALLSEESIEGSEFKLLQPYELCHVDASTKYGRAVAKAFRTDRYPYMAIIGKTGSVILYSKTGNIDAKDWEQALSQHKNGERPTVRTASHVSYRASEPVIIERPLSTPYFNNSYFPSCQRRAT
jgi:hypothetical protein